MRIVNVFTVLLDDGLQCDSIHVLTFHRGYYNHALRQVVYFFNKVIICIQEHSVMVVQVYAYSFIGKRFMNF